MANRSNGVRDAVVEIDFAELTDAGVVHATNEDAVAHWRLDDGLLFAVADGIGGGPGGDEASRLALDVLGREMDGSATTRPIGRRLRRAVQEANVAVHAKQITVPELRGMGTTLTASAVVGRTLVAAHVGDCRLLLLRDGRLTQLTKDHTWVAERLEHGLLSADDARTHPNRNVVTRCLGRELIVAIDVLTIGIAPGDVLLQCSDGVHGALGEAEMTELLQAHPPEAACRALVRRACEERGEDNVSVQVAAVGQHAPSAAARPWWRFGL